MNINTRQRARRTADRRRPIYRAAMWGCYFVACLSAWAFGRFVRYDLPVASVLCIGLCTLLTAYAWHFDGESRRIY